MKSIDYSQTITRKELEEMDEKHIKILAGSNYIKLNSKDKDEMIDQIIRVWNDRLSRR